LLAHYRLAAQILYMDDPPCVSCVTHGAAEALINRIHLHNTN